MIIIIKLHCKRKIMFSYNIPTQTEGTREEIVSRRGAEYAKCWNKGSWSLVHFYSVFHGMVIRQCSLKFFDSPVNNCHSIPLSGIRNLLFSFGDPVTKWSLCENKFRVTILDLCYAHLQGNDTFCTGFRRIL